MDLEGEWKRKLERRRRLYALLAVIGYGTAGVLLLLDSRDNAAGWIVLLGAFALFTILVSYHQGAVWLALTEYWKAHNMRTPLRAHWFGFTRTVDMSGLPLDAQFQQRCLRLAYFWGLVPLLAVGILGFLLRERG